MGDGTLRTRTLAGLASGLAPGILAPGILAPGILAPGILTPGTLTPPGRTRRDRVLLAVAGVGTLLGLLTAVMINPVFAADSGVPGKVATSGLLLNVRTGPSSSAPRDGMLPHGSRITVVCQEPGQNVYGKVRTTTLWDRLPDGRYVSDAYVSRAATPPRCGPTGRVNPRKTMTPTPSPSGTRPVSPPESAAWVAPIPGAVGSGYRTKTRPTHNGIDLPAAKNTPIYASATGSVITAECAPATKNCDVDGSLAVRGCGWYVDIAHADRVVTRYCHLVKKPSVNVGQRVKTGQLIGYVGSSGNSTGPHLHFEVHTNAPPTSGANAVEPAAFLRTKGVSLR